MHWGVEKARSSAGGPSSADGPSRLHVALAKAQSKKAAHDADHKTYSDALAEHEKNGFRSKTMQDVYGTNVNTDKFSFKAIHGQTLEQAHAGITKDLKDAQFLAKNASDRQQKKIDRIKSKLDKVKHSVDEVDVETFLAELDREDALEHHGVKGMKWGVKRAVAAVEAGHAARKEAKNTTSSDHDAAEAAKDKVKKTGVKSLSNQELQALVTRKNLEAQFNRHDEAGSTASKGHSIVKTVLGTGKTINEVIALANSPLGKAARQEIEKQIKKSKED